jgi:hypothetical protein
VRCPEYCADDTPKHECSCTCPETVLAGRTPYEVRIGRERRGAGATSDRVGRTHVGPGGYDAAERRPPSDRQSLDVSLTRVFTRRPNPLSLGGRCVTVAHYRPITLQVLDEMGIFNFVDTFENKTYDD